jgi:phosphatidylinositol glycan class U
MAVWAGLLGCFPDLAKSKTSPSSNAHHTTDLRHPLFSLTVHLYTSILLPLLHSLWLLSGTGNANFFYAATMVYGLNASLAVVDVLCAGIKLDIKRKIKGTAWDDERWVIIQLTGIDK